MSCPFRFISCGDEVVEAFVFGEQVADGSDDLWKAVGAACDLFTEDECLNYFIAAGYEPK